MAITSSVALQLGTDRQQLPFGIRVGSFLCDVLKGVSIPGHCQPPPSDLSRGVNSKLSPPGAVQMGRLGILFQRFPFTVKIKAEMPPPQLLKYS